MSSTPPGPGSQHAAAFAGYQPTTEFESRAIAVFDELLYALAAVRAELSALRVQVAANTESTNRNANRILEMHSRVGEIAHETRVMMEVVLVARRDLDEAARTIDAARREIRALTRDARQERPTDPELGRDSEPPPENGS